MGYLDDILSYATGNGEYDPYRSEDDNSDNSILSEEQRKRMLLGIHAPELYPNINDRGNGHAMDEGMTGRYDSTGAPILRRPSYIDEGPTGGPAQSPEPARSSIYEPGPNEAAYGEALRKPRPEYNPALEKKPWWQTALQIAVPSARGAFADPYKKAQEDYERRTGAYEGDIASKRGAASLEIGERDRQQRLREQEAEQQQRGAYYQRGIKHYDYLENQPKEPPKKSDYEIFKEDPEGYTNYLKAKEKPDQSLSDYQYWKADNPNGTYAQFLDFKERTTHKYDKAAGGAGGAGDAAKLRASKVRATTRKNTELSKLNARAQTDFLSPEEVRQGKQDIQDAFEQELEAGGHNVEHYEYPVEKEPAAQAKPPAQPGMISRAVGSIFGGGGGGAKPQITPEEAAAELRRRRGQR